jgi:hypothetical protein
VGEGIEKTLQSLQRQFSSLAPTFVIINDYEEEKHVEDRTIEVEEEEEVKQSTNFSSALVEG